jgi:hypothetical protein
MLPSIPFLLTFRILPEGSVLNVSPLPMTSPIDASATCGVQRRLLMPDNPHSVPSVGRVDGASWYNETLDFVVQAFQLSTHLSECHLNDPSNILANDPTGLGFSNNPKHLRPEEAVIFRSLSLSCGREGLTGETTCEEVNGRDFTTSRTLAPNLAPSLSR